MTLLRKMQQTNAANTLFRGLYVVHRRLGRQRYLAEVDVTDNCNLRCSHCYHFHTKSDFAGEIPLPVWRDRFLDLYSKGVRVILLVGGEPALRMDVLQLAAEIFPFVDLITNGQIHIPREYRHRLFVSLDGMQQTNDAIRGAGVFQKVLSNYRNDKRVVLNITLMEKNYTELQSIVELAIHQGYQGVVCNIYSWPESAQHTDKNVVLGQLRTEVCQELSRVRALYPRHLLMTQKMIRWFATADHRDFCYWRDSAYHYDVDWNRRKCFAEMDCSACGCFAGTFGNPLWEFLSPVAMYRLFCFR